MANPFDQFDDPSANPFDQFDEGEAPKKKKASLGTAVKSSFANVGNMADTALSTLAGSAAAMFGDEKEAVRIADEMEARRASRNQWANPDQEELGFGGKLAGTLATLPMQVVGMGLSPAETTRTALEAGESNEAARKAGLIDAAGNAIGVALPGFKQGSMLVRGLSGAGINAAQDVAAKLAIQSQMETEAGKKAFQPTFEDAAVSGVIGAGIGVASGKSTAKPAKKLEDIRAAQKQKAPEAKAPEAVKTNIPEQLNLFDQFDERSPVSPYQTEMAPDMWRVDENGIPIRADLSMEVQNLQQPLQRNLWGDEMEANFPRDPNKPLDMATGDIPGVERFSEPVQFRNDPEGQIPLTEAIDAMPEGIRNREGGKFAPGTTRQSALDLLRRELFPDSEMRTAVQEAEMQQWLRENAVDTKKPAPLGSKARKEQVRRTGWAKKQGGGVLMDPFGRVQESSDKLQDLLKTVPYRFQTLEGLPNKEKVTFEQIKQVVNREGVSAAEKSIIQDAYAIALFKDNNDFVSARDLVKGLEDAIQDLSLNKTPTKEYAEFGLDSIGRDAGTKWETIPRAEWTPAQLEEYLTYNIFPERKVSTDAGVHPITSIWGNDAGLSSGVKNHFDDDNYVGHSRTFVEDGVRHVVEIQSDLLQKIKETDSSYNTTKVLQKNWAVRIIREELADAAKKGESTVRFATADTMAKVEQWDNQHDVAISGLEKLETRLQEMLGEDRQFYSQDSIDYTIEKIEQLKSQLTGPKFEPRLQGIYDRYNKEVSKYLTSIGGKVVTDDKGHTWLEVPVESHRRRPIMFGQRGAVLIDWGKAADDMENSLLKVSDDGSYIPENPEMSSLLEKARGEQDGKFWRPVQSGSTSVAMKTGSTLIKGVSEVIQNALKRSELKTRQWVFPAENSLRKLSNQELMTLSSLMKDEMFQGFRYDGDILAESLSVKQLEAYTKMREVFDQTLAAQNEARVAQGKKPISAKEAYVSSRWEGDFRQPVYDADGKLVWYLADNTAIGLKRQAERLLKQDSSLKLGEQHKVQSLRGGADIQSMYSTMLDILGRDDPAVQRVKELVEMDVGESTANMLAQEKHFKSKSNVRGFVGDRPGTEGSVREARKMFQQQIQYAKNAFKWSEFQKSAGDLKKVLSDEELQRSQPNNIAYAREYVRNALGQNEGKVAKALDDAIRELGVSPRVVDKAVGSLKSFFIIQKLAASAGFMAANVIQTANVIPHLVNLREQGFKGNPAKAALVGTLAGPLMAFSHYFKAAGVEYVDQLPNQFFKDAIRYAEDNGVTARSVFDESPLGTSRLEKMAGTTLSAPETFVRSMAFMTYAQMLKDSGEFADHSKLFQMAEELTNMSMVDYRETERPLMFSKLGTTGNFLNTLQTYPLNFYNQWNYMLREAMDGRPGAIVSMLAIQYAIAGAMGIPGFDDMDKVYKWIRDNWTSTDTWAAAMKSPFFSDPKLWMLENFGESSVYGALSDVSGIGFTSRVTAPSLGAMGQSPIAPVTDIANQIGSVAKAVADPTNSVKLGQAAMDVSPVGFKGLLETAPFMEGITYDVNPDGTKRFYKTTDLADKKTRVNRTEDDIAVRKWGLKTQREVLEGDVAYATESQNRSIQTRSGELIDRYYSAVRRGDVKKANELNELYVSLTGKSISNTQLETQIKEEMFTDVQRTRSRANTPQQLLNIARMNKILENSK